MSRKTKAEKHFRRVQSRKRKRKPLHPGKGRRNPAYAGDLQPFDSTDQVIRGVLHIFQGLLDLGWLPKELSDGMNKPLTESELKGIICPDVNQ